MTRASNVYTPRYLEDINPDDKELTEEKWRGSLQQGERFEDFIREWLIERDIEAWKPTDKSYDIRMNIEVPLYGNLHLTAECKTDTTAQMTGNLAIQVFDSGKPSGIHKDGPCPDLWFHSTGKEFWVIRTSLLRSICKTHNSSWGSKVMPMGDRQSGAAGVLMPISVAKKAVGGEWFPLKETTEYTGKRVAV